MDPDAGRWLSEDPLGFRSHDQHLYRYAHNNPVNNTDPSGLQELPPVVLPGENDPDPNDGVVFSPRERAHFKSIAEFIFRNYPPERWAQEVERRRDIELRTLRRGSVPNATIDRIAAQWDAFRERVQDAQLWRIEYDQRAEVLSHLRTLTDEQVAFNQALNLISDQLHEALLGTKFDPTQNVPSAGMQRVRDRTAPASPLTTVRERFLLWPDGRNELIERDLPPNVLRDRLAEGAQLFVRITPFDADQPREGFVRPLASEFGFYIGTSEEIYAAVLNEYRSILRETDEAIAGSLLDALQFGLDLLGLLPVVGNAFDLINAQISAARGRVLDASLRLLAAIPLAGAAVAASVGVARLVKTFLSKTDELVTAVQVTARNERVMTAVTEVLEQASSREATAVLEDLVSAIDQKVAGLSRKDARATLQELASLSDQQADHILDLVETAARREAPSRRPIPGDADFIGPTHKTWPLSPTGQGAHMVERASVSGRPTFARFDVPETPRFYPAGSAPGAAHVRLHQATRNAGIRLRRGGNAQLSDPELLQRYRQAYSDPSLQGIRGDLRTPNSSTVIGTNLTPAEAFEALLRWHGGG